MVSNLAFVGLLYNRLEALQLTKPALMKRMGYVNVAKGLRRLNAILKADFSRIDPLFIDQLAKALELKPSVVQDMIAQTTVLQLKSSFTPHAYLVTDNAVPSPIFACAWGNFHALKYIRLPSDLSKHEYVEFIMKRLPLAIPTFGFVTGFHIHYDFETAVSFSLSGESEDALVCSPKCNLATLYI